MWVLFGLLFAVCVCGSGTSCFWYVRGFWCGLAGCGSGCVDACRACLALWLPCRLSQCLDVCWLVCAQGFLLLGARSLARLRCCLLARIARALLEGLLHVDCFLGRVSGASLLLSWSAPWFVPRPLLMLVCVTLGVLAPVVAGCERPPRSCPVSRCLGR